MSNSGELLITYRIRSRMPGDQVMSKLLTILQSVGVYAHNIKEKKSILSKLEKTVSEMSTGCLRMVKSCPICI